MVPQSSADVIHSDSGAVTRANATAETTGTETVKPANSQVTVSGIVAKRRHWTHNRRPVLFAPVEGGAGFDASLRRVEVGAWPGLLGSVAAYRMVYLCGLGAGHLVRSLFGRQLDGWVRTALHEHDRHPSVTFTHRESGAVVRLAAVAVWLGSNEVDPWSAAEAWRWVENELPNGASMLATPSSTGRDLMARMLPRGVELPTLTAEVGDEIRATSTQHRMTLEAPGLDAAGFVELDMRLAFAAVVRSLPVGKPVRMKGEPAQYEPYRAARYLCEWIVPERWTGPGLLPSIEGDHWQWINEPNRKGHGWVDGSELSIARMCGWRVHVSESLVWPSKLVCDPLRQWQENLTGSFLKTDQAKAPPGLSDKSTPLARAATRSIIIHAIGSLRGKGQVVTKTCSADDAATVVPAGAEWWATADDTVTWTERSEPAWEEWCRPEWTAAVWARTRCRLLDGPGASVGGRRTGNTGALNLPAGIELIGFRGDALYLTADPGWPDDGRPGRYRVKAAHGPMTVPGRLIELDELRRQSAAPSSAKGVAAARAALETGGARRGH